MTPPPMTRQVSCWGFAPYAQSESEVVPDLPSDPPSKIPSAGDPELSLSW